MLAYVFAVLSAAFYAFGNLIDSHLKNASFKTVTALYFYQSFMYLVTLLFLCFIGLPDFSRIDSQNIQSVAVAAAANIAYHVPYYFALGKIDTSIVVSLFAVSKILLPLFSYFYFGDEIAYYGYCGFGLIIATLLVLNMSRDSTRKFKLNSAFWVMCISSLCMVVTSVARKKTLEDVDWITFAYIDAISAPLLFVCLLSLPVVRTRVKMEFPIFKSNFKTLFSLELIFLAASASALYALEKLPLLEAEALGNTQALFVVLIAAIAGRCFKHGAKEEIDAASLVKKLSCILLLIVGIVLVLKA